MKIIRYTPLLVLFSLINFAHSMQKDISNTAGAQDITINFITKDNESLVAIFSPAMRQMFSVLQYLADFSSSEDENNTNPLKIILFNDIPRNNVEKFVHFVQEVSNKQDEAARTEYLNSYIQKIQKGNPSLILKASFARMADALGSEAIVQGILQGFANYLIEKSRTARNTINAETTFDIVSLYIVSFEKALHLQTLKDTLQSLLYKSSQNDFKTIVDQKFAKLSLGNINKLTEKFKALNVENLDTKQESVQQEDTTMMGMTKNLTVKQLFLLLLYTTRYPYKQTPLRVYDAYTEFENLPQTIKDFWFKDSIN